MTAIKYILKSILKLPALLLILLLQTAMLLAKMAGYVGAYILSPVMLFILGCGIYCLVKTRWTDVLLLFGMEAVIGILMFGGLWIYATVGDICDSIASFLHS